MNSLSMMNVYQMISPRTLDVRPAATSRHGSRRSAGAPCAITHAASAATASTPMKAPTNRASEGRVNWMTQAVATPITTSARHMPRQAMAWCARGRTVPVSMWHLYFSITLAVMSAPL